MKLTIAFLQLLPAGSLEENMEKGIMACREAKEKGADIALFPEMWSCGYAFPHDEASLRECARMDKVWACGIRLTDDRRFDASNWDGENILGFALMEVRNTLRGE